MSFNCTGCGACCKRMNNVAEMVKDIEELRFPYKIDESGRCEKLDGENKCSVYDNRPTVCNVDKMQEYMKIPKGQFYKMNAMACNKMIKEDGLDKKFLIKL